MNRTTSVVIVAAAVVLVIAVALLVRMGRDESVDERAMNRPAARHAENATRAPGSNHHSMATGNHHDRVQERLRRLRDNDAPSMQERQHAEGGSTPRAGAAPVLTPGMTAREQAPQRDPVEDQQELEQLERTLLTDPDPDERITAVFFLSSSDDTVVIPVLLKGLSDTDPEVRLAVVEALSDYSDDLQPAQLTAALNDPDPEVRFEALSILGDMDNPAVRPLVQSLLNDPDEDNQALARGILELEE